MKKSAIDYRAWKMYEIYRTGDNRTLLWEYLTHREKEIWRKIARYGGTPKKPKE